MSSRWYPRWLFAFVLSIIFPPLGFFYVQRFSWAFFYFILCCLGIVGVLYLKPHILWLLYLIPAIHASIISVKSKGFDKRTHLGRWYGLLTTLVVVYGTFGFTSSYLFDVMRTFSQSMEPSLSSGSLFIVDKRGFGDDQVAEYFAQKHGLASIKRGDLILFQQPGKKAGYLVKRIIGLPNDQLVYKDKKLVINGKPLTYEVMTKEEPFILLKETLDSKTYQIKVMHQARAVNLKATVSPKGFFVLGDNRDRSHDSRLWGFVHQNKVVGKIRLVK